MDILEKEKCIQIQRELIDKIQIKNIVEKDEIKTKVYNGRGRFGILEER